MAYHDRHMDSHLIIIKTVSQPVSVILGDK